MKEFGDIVREKGLQAYSCARAEFEGTNVTLLDANENPFASEYNRYPDPFHRELKREIGRLKGVEVSRLVLGNGSDELIDMLIRTVCTPRRDNMLVFSPGYSMYEVSGRVNDVEVRCLELDGEFQPEWNTLFDSVDRFTKMIFFCTPNNPVGNVSGRWRLVLMGLSWWTRRILILLICHRLLFCRRFAGMLSCCKLYPRLGDLPGYG